MAFPERNLKLIGAGESVVPEDRRKTYDGPNYIYTFALGPFFLDRPSLPRLPLSLYLFTTTSSPGRGRHRQTLNNHSRSETSIMALPYGMDNYLYAQLKPHPPSIG